MSRDDFLSVIRHLEVERPQEAAKKWEMFAAECVDEGQFVDFKPAESRDASIERWLDTICGGLYAVHTAYGPETAAKVAALSLEQCCLYPGEMLQAAECLQNGGNAETIITMIREDKIEAEEPFFPRLPQGAAWENYLKTAEMGCEQNYNQIDGIINNTPPKPSVMNSLRQYQREADKFRDGTAPPAPHRDPER